MSDTTKNWHRVTLVLTEPNDDTDVLTATLETCLDADDVIPAIMAASQDFLESEKGREVWEETCHNFNYGDFLLNVTDEFCEPHGIRILEDDYDAIVDYHGTQLASLPDIDDDPDEPDLPESTDDRTVDMKILYAAEPADALIQNLTIRTADGRVLHLQWMDHLAEPGQKHGTILLCKNVVTADEKAPVSMSDLENCQVLHAAWYSETGWEPENQTMDQHVEIEWIEAYQEWPMTVYAGPTLRIGLEDMAAENQ